MKAILVFLITNFLMYCFMGWILMLLVGAIHSAAPSLPTFSFWLSVLICFVCTVLLNLARGSKD